MPEQLWHPIPGRLQSVSVADKAHIWGVTLDLQLAKFNSTTQQWQLVSVTTEAANQNRYSSSSSHSANTFGSNASFGSVSGRASKTIAALLPSFGMGSASSSSSLSVNVARSSMGSRPTSASTSGEPSPAFDGSFMSPRTGGGGSGGGGSGGGGEEDEDTDSTVQVSAAVDGTVVRLDKTLKACVASISQIWGLSDSGDIYYGSSDRFVQLEAAVTSGAGYGQPQFTHISVGLDNTVLATDAHTGTVFRLKKSDATVQQQSHPPLWTALTGTGPRGLHIANCSLSTSDFVVGVAWDGRCYRFSNGHWTTMGGGAKIDNVGVGADGYVIGVDRDGDLFGFQLERLVVPARTVPKAVATKGKIGDDNNNSYFSSKQEYEAMEMPKTPTQQKSFSRRPMASPRELFEMAAGDRGKSSEKLVLGGAAAATATIAAGRSSMVTSHAPRGNAYSRYTMVRSESTMSKRSYASDIGSGRTTPNGLNIIHHPSEEPSPPVPEESPGASSGSESLDMLSPHPKSPLRIQTKRTEQLTEPVARVVYADTYSIESYNRRIVIVQ
ncbi:hypothetical protein BG000_003199 [Podila horticola]|nr:hypothetical protein BG000_003199 [Podila horticola]